MAAPLYLGIDVGASATKAVILDTAGSTKGMAIEASGMDFTRASGKAVEQVLSAAGASPADIRFTVSTGYGRKNVAIADMTKTEISCHGRGVFHHFPEAITVVDIGGQDNKIIKLDADGKLRDFTMNRKCAAGTGAFLEEIAGRIGIAAEQMEALARQSTVAVEIGAFCTVFSFTEILTMSRQGVRVPDIVMAVFKSVVKRIMEMNAFSGSVVASGGVVAHNPTIVKLLSEASRTKVSMPPKPQFAGALGAALFAMEESEKNA